MAPTHHLNNRAGIAQYLKRNLGWVELVPTSIGKENVMACLKDDPAKLEAESEQVFRQFRGPVLRPDGTGTPLIAPSSIG